MLELLFIAPSTILAAELLFVARKLTVATHRFKMSSFVSPDVKIDDLPSVSVCIPARNETHAMTQCLESVLASTYPKLEVVVLDDSSTDDTPFLIKSFAHAGVRFVEGVRLEEGWLGKNHALQNLSLEASGTYILFMDVDTQLQPDTIEQFVAYAQQESAAMVSILPQRQDSLRASTLFSPLRYFWELVLHKRSTPATSSSAWMINRHVLRDELSGFAPYALDVQPESSIAAALMATNRYRFLIGTPLLGVVYEKKWSSQIETSIRLLYPRLGGRLWRGVVAIIALTTLWLPVGGLLASAILGPTITAFCAASLSISITLYGFYLSRVRQSHWWFASLLWPVILTQEIIILIISMVKYGRGTVTWKGRSVVAPKAIRELQQEMAR